MDTVKWNSFNNANYYNSCVDMTVMKTVTSMVQWFWSARYLVFHACTSDQHCTEENKYCAVWQKGTAHLAAVAFSSTDICMKLKDDSLTVLLSAVLRFMSGSVATILPPWATTPPPGAMMPLPGATTPPLGATTPPAGATTPPL